MGESKKAENYITDHYIAVPLKHLINHAERRGRKPKQGPALREKNVKETKAQAELYERYATEIGQIKENSAKIKQKRRYAEDELQAIYGIEPFEFLKFALEVEGIELRRTGKKSAEGKDIYIVHTEIDESVQVEKEVAPKPVIDLRNADSVNQQLKKLPKGTLISWKEVGKILGNPPRKIVLEILNDYTNYLVDSKGIILKSILAEKEEVALAALKNIQNLPLNKVIPWQELKASLGIYENEDLFEFLEENTKYLLANEGVILEKVGKTKKIK